MALAQLKNRHPRHPHPHLAPVHLPGAAIKSKSITAAKIDPEWKISGNLWKTLEISGNLWKTLESSWKSLEISGNYQN